MQLDIRGNIAGNLFYQLVFIGYLGLVIFVKPCSCTENKDCFYQGQLERKILDNKGFPRLIFYDFNLTTNCSVYNCNLCLQETIPSNLFVSKFQLEDLQRLGRLSATVDGDVDIEAPESSSSPFIVRMFKQLRLDNNVFSGHVTLPVYTRYHDPKPGGGFRTFSMGQPEMYVHCMGLTTHEIGAIYLTPCAGNDKEPLPYRKVPFTMANGYKLEMEVPVGDSDAFALVYAGTYTVVIAGAIYLAGVLYQV